MAIRSRSCRQACFTSSHSLPCCAAIVADWEWVVFERGGARRAWFAGGLHPNQIKELPLVMLDKLTLLTKLCDYCCGVGLDGG